MFTLRKRTAIITGGTRGIGFAIAKKFLDEGMNVAILSSNKNNIDKALAELSLYADYSIGYVCDVSDISAIKNTIYNINCRFNGIDVLVNCAGILDTLPIEMETEENWDKVIDVNLKGVFFMTQQTIPYLEKSKAPRIINISSNAGRMGGFENGLAYSASKGGVIALTYGFARRLAPKQITVNCIAPGTIVSEMSSAYDNDAKKRLIERFPLGRFGNVDDVASAACYFASEESGFTTGAVLDVNGGLFMG